MLSVVGCQVCGINMRNATHKHAVTVLRQCGNNLTIKVQYNPESELFICHMVTVCTSLHSHMAMVCISPHSELVTVCMSPHSHIVMVCLSLHSDLVSLYITAQSHGDGLYFIAR